jgi:hypothetical protein
MPGSTLLSIRALATQTTATVGHPRRRPSGSNHPTASDLQQTASTSPASGTSLGGQPQGPTRTLSPIPSIPSTPTRSPHMSLARTPSPNVNEGWSSRGLTDESYSKSNGMATLGNNDEQWAAAKAKSQQVRGQPSIQRKNEGFFQRSRRKISQTLPLPAFHKYGHGSRTNWRETEKLGRGRWAPREGGTWSRIRTFVGNVLRRFRVVLIVLVFITLSTMLISQTGKPRQVFRPGT